jgi:hypothetical protein
MTDQKFCRSCGLNLEQTANSLLQQFPNAEYADLQKSEKMLERFGNVVFTGFGLAILAGVLGLIYWILTNMDAKQPAVGILLIFFLVFAVLSLCYVFAAETLKEKRKKISPRLGPQQTPDLVTPKRLADDAYFHPAESVVEDTTELLKTPRKSR